MLKINIRVIRTNFFLFGVNVLLNIDSFSVKQKKSLTTSPKTVRLNTTNISTSIKSGIKLEEVKTLPSNLISQYINKTDTDLNKIIELLGSKSYEELNYNELDCLAFSYYYLNKKQLAIDKINEAIRKFKETKDIFDKDKNELLEIKEFKKLIISGK